jgi:hypothetical protein
MANIFETLNPGTDVTTTRTLLHEAIPLTGSIVSGTYTDKTTTGEENIKNYSHGMFQSVYDYPYLSSSANHIFDLTVGYSDNSDLSSSANVQNAKKINMYNELALVCLGTDVTGAIEQFENDLVIADDNNLMKEMFFVNFSRLLVKDSIKKGTFSLVIGTGSWSVPFGVPTSCQTITDSPSASATQGTAEGQTGDWAPLYVTTPAYQTGSVGAIFYNLGIVALTGAVFTSPPGQGNPINHEFLKNNGIHQGISGAFTNVPISAACDGFRHRIQNISFNNTTEINSAIYFCRAPATKFNYSSNPTYTTGSKIRVKEEATSMPRAYVTTVGLYNASNELLAVAKLSEPLRKDPNNELTLRVRLDY